MTFNPLRDVFFHRERVRRNLLVQVAFHGSYDGMKGKEINFIRKLSYVFTDPAAPAPATAAPAPATAEPAPATAAPAPATMVVTCGTFT